MPWSAAILSIASAICFSSRKATNLFRFTVVNPVKHILATFRMGKMGTKSMKQLDLSQIPFATAEIAESWKRDYKKGVLKGHQRRKHPLPMRCLVWIEINEHPGKSWRQLNEVFTKHSLSAALSWLLKKGLVKRIESTWFDGRGRKPTRYFAISRPFMVTYAKTIRLKHNRGDFSKGDKESFYGSLVTVMGEPITTWIKDPRLDPRFQFKKDVRQRPRKCFIRLTHEERRRLDATLIQIAAGKRSLIWASLTQVLE